MLILHMIGLKVFASAKNAPQIIKGRINNSPIIAPFIAILSLLPAVQQLIATPINIAPNIRAMNVAMLPSVFKKYGVSPLGP